MAPRPSKGSGRSEGEAGEPRTFASTTPPDYPNARYDFTLQAVMEMRESIGQLKQAVQTLSDHSRNQGDKLDKLRIAFYSAAAVTAVLIGLVGWFLGQLGHGIMQAVTKIISLNAH